MPGDSTWPLVVALGLLLVAYGALPNLIGVRLLLGATGVLLTSLGLARWFWPTNAEVHA
ncbi:hypothetical protein D3C83_207280 [compost metagenome]